MNGQEEHSIQFRQFQTEAQSLPSAVLNSLKANQEIEVIELESPVSSRTVTVTNSEEFQFQREQPTGLEQNGVLASGSPAAVPTSGSGPSVVTSRAINLSAGDTNAVRRNSTPASTVTAASALKPLNAPLTLASLGIVPTGFRPSVPARSKHPRSLLKPFVGAGSPAVTKAATQGLPLTFPGVAMNLSNIARMRGHPHPYLQQPIAAPRGQQFRAQKSRPMQAIPPLGHQTRPSVPRPNYVAAAAPSAGSALSTAPILPSALQTLLTKFNGELMLSDVGQGFGFYGLVCRKCQIPLEDDSDGILRHLRSEEHIRGPQGATQTITDPHPAKILNQTWTVASSSGDVIVVSQNTPTSSTATAVSNSPPKQVQPNSEGGTPRTGTTHVPIAITVENALQNQHARSRKMLEFRKAGSYSDVSVICRDAIFSCHKVVLAASSSFFAEKFQDQKNSHNYFLFWQYEVEEFKAVLDYCYTGKATLPADRFDSFIEILNALGIEKNFSVK